VNRCVTRRGSRGVSETHTFYQNDLAMKNTADVTGGKLIAVQLQSISGVAVVNPLVAFYGVHGRNLYVFALYDNYEYN
jgi:hypothetical protein